MAAEQTQESMGAGAGEIFRRLLSAGHECYLVGGSVRDRLLGRAGADLDFTTNARPAEIQLLFRRTYYPNRFGTVLVMLHGNQYEVTTYRGEGRYSDHRHPDEITFVDTLDEDLKRRDFTINAMAMDVEGRIVDPFGGQTDLQRSLLRAVGDAEERLTEDPLRMMRAARLAAQLCFSLEEYTWKAIVAKSGLLAMISRERVRDELLKLLASPHPVTGIDFLDHLGLLPDILPALVAIQRFNRPPEQELDLYQHALQSLRYCPGGGLLRLIALLHVVGETLPNPPAPFPRKEGGDDRSDERSDRRSDDRSEAWRGWEDSAGASRVIGGSKGVGAGLKPAPTEAEARSDASGGGASALERALARLRLSNADVERALRLVEGLTAIPPNLPADEPHVRRLLARYRGLLPDLLALVAAHRRGLGGLAADANLAQLRRIAQLADMIESEHQPLVLSDLAVTGSDIMRSLGVPPGKAVGRMLHLLLERVLEEPSLNTRDDLLAMAAATRKTPNECR